MIVFITWPLLYNIRTTVKIISRSKLLLKIIYNNLVSKNRDLKKNVRA